MRYPVQKRRFNCAPNYLFFNLMNGITLPWRVRTQYEVRREKMVNGELCLTPCLLLTSKLNSFLVNSTLFFFGSSHDRSSDGCLTPPYSWATSKKGSTANWVFITWKVTKSFAKCVHTLILSDEVFFSLIACFEIVITIYGKKDSFSQQRKLPEFSEKMFYRNMYVFLFLSM